MTFILILFFASLLSTAGILFFKVRLLRAGKIKAPTIEGNEHLHIPHIDMSSAKQIAKKTIKENTHKVAIFVIKNGVIASYLVTKNVKKYWPKIISALTGKKAHTDGIVKSRTMSYFLKAIGEYKEKAKRFHKKIKEEDSQGDHQGGSGTVDKL